MTIWCWWCGRIIRSRRAEGVRFADTLDFRPMAFMRELDYLRSQYAATQRASRCGCAFTCPVSTRCAGWWQANMVFGLIPDRAFDVVGAGMGLRSIGLCDEWARRELKSSCVTLATVDHKPSDARPSPGRGGMRKPAGLGAALR